MKSEQVLSEKIRLALVSKGRGVVMFLKSFFRALSLGEATENLLDSYSFYQAGSLKSKAKMLWNYFFQVSLL